MAATLLHIGGGRLQLATIRWAREAGLEVVVTDADPDAPGRRLADGFEVIAASDVEGLVSLALSIHAHTGLAGATCSSDAGLEAVAAVGEATGTPANAPAAVRAAQDRCRAREAWHGEGVPTTAARAVESADEVSAALDELGLPATVQPADVRVASSVRTVGDEREAGEAFGEARRHGSRVLIERWTPGRRLGVNAFFRDGAYIPCDVHERFLSPEPHRLPVRGALPTSLERPEARTVHALVEHAARALELTVGPVKAEVIWTDDGPLVCELAPRFHDDVVTAYAARLVYGKSPVQAWLAALVDAGGPFDTMPTKPWQHAGWLAIVPAEAGVLHGVFDVERARAVTGVEDVAVLREPGHRIRNLGDASAVVGCLWARGWDAGEVEERLRTARERLKVETVWRSVA